MITITSHKDYKLFLKILKDSNKIGTNLEYKNRETFQNHFSDFEKYPNQELVQALFGYDLEIFVDFNKIVDSNKEYFADFKSDVGFMLFTQLAFHSLDIFHVKCKLDIKDVWETNLVYKEKYYLSSLFQTDREKFFDVCASLDLGMFRYEDPYTKTVAINPDSLDEEFPLGLSCFLNCFKDMKIKKFTFVDTPSSYLKQEFAAQFMKDLREKPSLRDGALTSQKPPLLTFASSGGLEKNELYMFKINVQKFEKQGLKDFNDETKQKRKDKIKEKWTKSERGQDSKRGRFLFSRSSGKSTCENLLGNVFVSSKISSFKCSDANVTRAKKARTE